MEEAFLDALYGAVKRDDVKSFSALMESKPCGEYRMGRFPVLSAIFLYNASRIYKKFAKRLEACTAKRPLAEPVALSDDFRKRAGKCMRLYLADPVSPAEMLAACGEYNKLKKRVASLRPNAKERERIIKCIYVRDGLYASFKGDSIALPRRPMTDGQKKKLAICIAAALALAAGAIAAPLAIGGSDPLSFGNSPSLSADGTYHVTNLQQIDFASQNSYTLEGDLTLGKNFNAQTVNCTVYGNGKKIKTQGEHPFGVLNSTFKDVTFESVGCIFGRVAPDGVLQNVTVNERFSSTVNLSYGFVADENMGIIEDLTLNLSGTATAALPADPDSNAMLLGGVAAINGYKSFLGSGGSIENCTVNLQDFHIKGEAGVNTYFSAVAGNNNWLVEGCEVTGALVSDTVDVAGVCVNNYNLISGCINGAAISQTSDSDVWSPNVAGVCINNGGTVRGCKNEGALSASGKVQSIVGGIACANTMQIANCVSSGEITADGPVCVMGGVTALSDPAHEGNTIYTMINVQSCVCTAKITCASSDGTAYMGGLIGRSVEYAVGAEPNRTYAGASIYSSYFTGKLVASCTAYLGGLAGVAGKNSTENGLAVGSMVFQPYEGNYFKDSAGAINSVGAKYTYDDDGEITFGEGATVGATCLSEQAIKALPGYMEIMGTDGSL